MYKFIKMWLSIFLQQVPILYLLQITHSYVYIYKKTCLENKNRTFPKLTWTTNYSNCRKYPPYYQLRWLWFRKFSYTIISFSPYTTNTFFFWTQYHKNENEKFWCKRLMKSETHVYFKDASITLAKTTANFLLISHFCVWWIKQIDAVSQ